MAYRATLGSLLLSCLLLAGTLYGPSGCDDTMNCTLQGCVASYELELESIDPALKTGLWHVALEVDGFAIEADCMVSGPEDSVCDVGAWETEPDRPLDISVRVGQRIENGSGEPTDTGDLPELGNQAVFVTITANDEMPPVTVLDVTAQHEGMTILETERTPTYEIDDAFNGPGCGSCPRPLEETVALP